MFFLDLLHLAYDLFSVDTNQDLNSSLLSQLSWKNIFSTLLILLNSKKENKHYKKYNQKLHCVRYYDRENENTLVY